MGFKPTDSGYRKATQNDEYKLKPLMGLEPTASALKDIGKQRTTIVLQWPNFT